MICVEVTYADHQIGHYLVPEGQGWKVDAALRMLVIGRGVPRKMIPLDSVQMIEVVERPLPSIDQPCQGCVADAFMVAGTTAAHTCDLSSRPVPTTPPTSTGGA